MTPGLQIADAGLAPIDDERRSKWLEILYEMFLELQRAREMWPDCMTLPDGTGGSGRKTWETLARNSCERAYRERRLTHTHVFDEETAEAMAAETPAELRAELVQVGAMCLKWIADIDSRPVRGKR